MKQVRILSRDHRLFALVVPCDSYLDQALDRDRVASFSIRKWQKTYDLNQSSKAAVSAPAGFNTIGWDSSYTRAPLPLEHMHEWVDTSVDSILRLGARSIYEIGCGSGMLLLRIAPQCERYVGVDFSHEAICRVREQLQALPSIAGRVELLERRADNFDGLDPQSFDAVVINSAIQYFPHAAYLGHVLENAVRLVRDGGHVFIGDVRNLPLLPAFAASVELFHATDDLQIAELRDRVQHRLRHTPELVLSPAWFLSLQHRCPRIAEVQIALRRGRADNEMTRYRYDAILHVAPECDARHSAVFGPASAEPIAQTLRQLRNNSEVFGISGIPNGRIERDILALELLRGADPARTAGSLRRELEQSSARGVHPQDLFDLEASHPGVRVVLSWAAARCDGSYDALIVPANAALNCAYAVPDPAPSTYLHLANAPGQSGIRASFMEHLLDHCRHFLPPSDVPGRIALVDEIPAAANAEMFLAEICKSGFGSAFSSD